MDKDIDTIRRFHCICLYDLFVEADKVEEDFLQVQYEELGIDVENPPEFTFWCESDDSMEQLFWYFGVIIDYAFNDIPTTEAMGYEYVPME